MHEFDGESVSALAHRKTLNTRGYATAHFSKSNVQVVSNTRSKDYRVLMNSMIYDFIINWTLFNFNLGDKIFSNDDNKAMFAVKFSVWMQIVDYLQSALLSRFPNLII